MSELLGGDETLLSLWPDNFVSKTPGLDWLLKDQQLIPIPIVLLDDGRVAFKSDDGQVCLLDGLQGEGEDVFLPMPPVSDPTTELPPLSDAAIKSILVQADLDPELSLVGADMPHLSDKDLPPAPSPSSMDDDLKALVSFRCQYCSFSSADVPSLMKHSETEHAQPETLSEQSCDSEVDVESPLPSVDLHNEASEELPTEANVVEHFVYLCSECKDGFSTVSECRDHMIKDHEMVFDQNNTEEPMDEPEKDVEEELLLTLPPPVPSPAALPPPPSPQPAIPLEPVNTQAQSPTPDPAPVPAAPLAVKPTAFLKLPAKPKPKEYDPEFEAKPHKCPEPFCCYKFRTLTNLEAHLECHAYEDSRRFVCPKCSMLFVRWGQCSLHLWNTHNIDIDLYSCSGCNTYKTTTRKKLESHAKIHSDERPHKCNHCGKGFKQRTQLVNHTVSVHNKDKGIGSKWYMSQKCEICHKTYADSKCLKKHMQAVHSKLKPYKCQICGHMSARKAMLQAHVRQHTGEKPYACVLCTFKTGDHNSLRRHVMRHTGKRPYSCPHCPYSSIQSSSFKSHLQTRHPGQSGVHTCLECCFITVSEQSYLKHLSDHKLNLIPPSEVEVFPENVAAAHLVYRSFGASPSRLHCDVTASSTSRDRMKQTITISIPSEESAVTDDEDTAHCYLPGDDIDRGGITIPAEPEVQCPETLICFD